jgi:hypothetical protein
VKWRIWYADGRSVSSDDCAPSDAPGYGVQAIAQPDRTPGTGNVGHVVLSGHDWYYWRTDSEEWAGCDGNSIFDLILHREPITGVCQGRRIPTERYNEILHLAAEMGLPRKSGFRPTGERA